MYQSTWTPALATASASSLGLLAGADHVEVEHGDLEQFRFVARYARDGHGVGILRRGMPKQLAAAYRQLSRSLGERAEAGVPALA